MFHVVVQPRSLGDFGFCYTSSIESGMSEEQREKEYRQRCEEIAAEIKRHVSNIQGVHIVRDEE